MKVNHIFFDLDHTLWDFEANSNIAFETILKKHSINIDLQEFLVVYRGINHNYWKLYRQEKVTKEELRIGRLKDTFNKLKYKINYDVINRLSIDYIEVLPNNNLLFEGTIELLDYLNSKYNLHIITNGFNEVQYKKLENAGLSKYFDKIITSEDAGVKKPNPTIFNFALKEACATAQESVMIGDNWEADIMGAIDCGIDAIYFNYEKKLVGENIKSVYQLLDIKNYL